MESSFRPIVSSDGFIVRAQWEEANASAPVSCALQIREADSEIWRTGMSLSLQDKLDRNPNFVEVLRNTPAPTSPSAFPVVPPEFSNWRDEQKAWAESVALLDQTHHMAYEWMRGK